MRQSRDWKPSQWRKGSAITDFFSYCKICSGENLDYGLGWRLGGELHDDGSGVSLPLSPAAPPAASPLSHGLFSEPVVEECRGTVGRGVFPSYASPTAAKPVPPSCRAMSSEKHVMAFLAVIRRLNRSKLGLTVAVDDNILLIHAIEEKSPVAEWNKRCRTCGVPDLINQQLLESDQLVSINGETELPGIMEQLLDESVDSFYMRIRRLPS
jgi:hypothetical protein